MARLFGNLIVLWAVLLMPFGMAPAVASPDHHQAATSMPMQHCPEQSSPNAAHGGFAECTMACAAALPAGDAGPTKRMIILCAPEPLLTVKRLGSLHPDIATPPPKRS
jgi:hypothetical protein